MFCSIMSHAMKSPLRSLKLSKRIAEGARGKLDFDYACGRGHSFGEYHVHGVVNEILCSGLDPIRHRVHSGFAHPTLQTPGSLGRKREVDFAVEMLGKDTHAFYAEVKWAGSSHCSQENILSDLCRLQIIKNSESGAECIFVLAGQVAVIDELFNTGILAQGTNCLLHRNGAAAVLGPRGRKRRTKNFSLNGNVDHAVQLTKMTNSISSKLPPLPERVFTHLIYSARSASSVDRFQTLVWAVEVDQGS